MILQQLTELTLMGVIDANKANQERIAISVNETINLGSFGIMVGIRATNGMAVPIRDNFLWFGEGIVNQGDWILVYTCAGQPTVYEIPNTTNKIYSIHWGRQKTMFGHADVVPVLFSVGSVQVPESPIAIPHQEQAGSRGPS